MLTGKMNYKIPGVTIQGLILRQMHMSAMYAREAFRAYNNGDPNGEYTYETLQSLEQAEINSLLELQGIVRDTDEYNMVWAYIRDMIAYMA